MKKLFLLLALVPMFMMAQERRIVVIADPHVLAPELMDTASLSFKEMIQTQRKMIQWSAEAFDAVLDTCKRYNTTPGMGLDIEAVLIVGDLTKDGEKESHDYVLEKIKELLMYGIQVYVIPGNHDIGGKAYRYVGDEKEEVETIDRDGWNNYYLAEVMKPSSHDRIQYADFNTSTFAVEPFEGLTILGIDGSDDDASIGRLDDNDRGFIINVAEKAREKGNTIIAMSHWQVLEHFDQQGTLSASCRFEDADEIRDFLMEQGVHLLLTGHFHVNGITTYKDSTGVIPDSLVEITTGSPITYPLPFRILTISEDRARVKVETRYLKEPISGHNDVQAYSREWMKEHVDNLIPSLTLRGFAKAEEIMDTYGVQYLVQAGLTEDAATAMINLLKGCIPATDEAKIDLVRRNVGEALKDLYILHSDANEPQNPNAQAIADALYTGMENMMVEMISTSTALYWAYKMGQLGFIVSAPEAMAREIVQSLIEDKTNRSSALWSDVTDDLRGVLMINEPFTGGQAIDDVEADNTIRSRKQIRDGQLFIERGEKTFTVTGAETK